MNNAASFRAASETGLTERITHDMLMPSGKADPTKSAYDRRDSNYAMNLESGAKRMGSAMVRIREHSAGGAMPTVLPPSATEEPQRESMTAAESQKFL